MDFGYELSICPGKPRETLIELVAELISYNKYLNSKFLPYRKHFISITKTNRLMFLREMIASYSETHKKYDKLRENNSELFTVTAMVHIFSTLLNRLNNNPFP